MFAAVSVPTAEDMASRTDVVNESLARSFSGITLATGSHSPTGSVANVNKQRCTSTITGDALEQKIAQALRDRMAEREIVGTVGVVGAQATWCDIEVTLMDGVTRGLQVKTIAKRTDGSYRMFDVNGYPSKCLIVAATTEWTHFLACLFSLCQADKSKHVSINFNGKYKTASTRRFAEHMFGSDSVTVWLDHIIEQLPITQEVTRENKLEYMSSTQQLEYLSIERLNVKLQSVGLIFVAHGTLASVIDGWIHRLKEEGTPVSQPLCSVQLKTTTSKGKGVGVWLVRVGTHSHSEAGQQFKRPYSAELDPFDYLLVEADGLHWWIIPHSALVTEGVVSVGDQPGRQTMQVRLPDMRQHGVAKVKDEYHSYLDGWKQLLGEPIEVIDRWTKVPFTREELLARSAEQRRIKRAQAKANKTDVDETASTS